jgi:hypothetical protein
MSTMTGAIFSDRGPPILITRPARIFHDGAGLKPADLAERSPFKGAKALSG